MNCIGLVALFVALLVGKPAEADLASALVGASSSQHPPPEVKSGEPGASPPAPPEGNGSSDTTSSPASSAEVSEPQPAPHDGSQRAAGVATPQPAFPEDVRQANDSLYVEALGPAIYYSLNYDRIIGPVAARIGVGMMFGKEESQNGVGGSVPTTLLLAIPITVSYVGDGPLWDMFEAGAGVVITHVAARASGLYIKENATAVTAPIATAFLGYRYQPPDGGLLVRVGISTLVSRYGFYPVWPYGSLGVAF